MIGRDLVRDGAMVRRAAALGLAGQVRCHFFLQHHAMRPYFEQADLLALTSR
jgi:hypothetical protein